MVLDRHRVAHPGDEAVEQAVDFVELFRAPAHALVFKEVQLVVLAAAAQFFEARERFRDLRVGALPVLVIARREVVRRGAGKPDGERLDGRAIPLAHASDF